MSISSQYRVTGKRISPLQVEIVCLGNLATNSALSLAYYGPAFETAIDDLNQREYKGILNFSLIFVYDQQEDAKSRDHLDNRLANWYYESRAPTANVTVILTPGK